MALDLSMEMEVLQASEDSKERRGVQFEVGSEEEDMTLLLRRQHRETLEILRGNQDILQRLDSHFSRSPFTESSPTQSKNLLVALSANSSEMPGSGGCSTTPKLFQSYSFHDSQLKEEASTAHAQTSRARFSVFEPHALELPKASSKLSRIVQSPVFDAFFACIVVTNAIYIGVEVEFELRDEPTPLAMKVLGYLFTAFFTLELVVRVCAHGCRIFCDADWAWSFLDLFIVLSSFWEIVVDFLQGKVDGLAGLSSLKAFRIIRLTRIFKTAQLMRIFRFVIALRTLVRSILHTLKALLWALLLLALIIYVFAVLFTQTVHAYVVDSHPLPDLEKRAIDRYFGSLANSMLSLFKSIAGGVSWEDVLGPLASISVVWALLFLFYISFTYFAVLNVVTGVFCQSAIESAQNDHLTVAQSLIDDKESHITRMKALFTELGAEEVGVITYQMFEEKIRNPTVREYFETLGINVYDAWSFFKLLDADGGGAVELEEFFLGCLRFRGQARAIEVGKVLQDQQWLIKNHGHFQSFVESEINSLRQLMDGLIAALIGTNISGPQPLSREL